MATKKQFTTKTPRTPALEGPDVIYTGSDWDAFSDGCWLGSYTNNQDAWIEARRVYFYKVQDTAVAVADDEAEADAELTEARELASDLGITMSDDNMRLAIELSRVMGNAMTEDEYDECRALACECGVDLAAGHWNEARAEVAELVSYADRWNDTVAHQWSARLLDAYRVTCRNCEGAHETQRCPEIARALFV